MYLFFVMLEIEPRAFTLSQLPFDNSSLLWIIQEARSVIAESPNIFVWSSKEM